MKSRAGEIIKRKRLELEMTQASVAEMVRSRKNVTLSENFFRRIEKGISNPNVMIAMEIADVLDTDVYEIWG